MVILLALGISLAIGIFLLMLLRMRLVNSGMLKGRLAQYSIVKPKNERTPADQVKKKDLRSMSTVFGKLAPKQLSQHYSRILQQASIPLKGEEMASLIMASTIGGVLLGGILLSVPGWLVGGFVGAKMPGWMLQVHLRRRQRALEGQIVELLHLSSNAMRAGHSFLQALELAGREMPDPMGQEIRRSMREVNLGLTVEESLVRMLERVPSADLDLVITAVLIQRQVGGDLAGIFDNIAGTIMERQKIKAQVRTLTAQGRLSGLVISLLPIGLLLVLNVMNPEYISTLWKEPFGILLLCMGAVSQVIGIMFIRKIVNIEV